MDFQYFGEPTSADCASQRAEWQCVLVEGSSMIAGYSAASVAFRLAAIG
jgi:hypothetical protein